jgi:hypothetical protein
MNPRSYADIRKAVREGHAKSRGELMRQVQQAFREPAKIREIEEAEAQETQAQVAALEKTVTKKVKKEPENKIPPKVDSPKKVPTSQQKPSK